MAVSTPPRWPFVAGLVAIAALVIADMLRPELAPWPGYAIAFVALALGLYGTLAARDAADAEPLPESAPVRVEPAPAVRRDDPRVAELERELARHRELERELVAARQEAEAAMLAKGEFLATMSHEIRTPLNGIIPLLDIVLSTGLEKQQREYLATAYQSARQLLSIVDDILDYSKIEAQKLELETVGLNLRDLVEGVTRLLGRNAEAKGLRLAVSIDPSLRLAARGDPTRLRQVLTNLVSNAIKFTDRGSITIELRKRGDTRTQTDVLFSVTDTGIGISPEQQAGLFQPFAQADASTTRTFGGTGLGLVICRRIVELMQGRIGVRSEPGKGSTFWFSVPLLKAVGDVAPARTDLQGSRVLIASPDQALAKRLVPFFNAWGMQAATTTIPADALAKLRTAAGSGGQWGYDFVLVDFAGVQKSATALARNVLKDPALEQVRVLAIQGDDEVPAELRESPRFAAYGRQVREPELRAGLVRLLESDPAAPEAAPVESLLPKLEAAPPDAAPAPRAAAPVPAPAPASPAAVAPAAPVAGVRVLLVEDNAVNRTVAQRLLQLAGIAHDAAENGRLALDRLEQAHYDAVLMDCMMPVLDGYAATRAIRKLEQDGVRAGHIPIVAMTANAMAGDREKCLAAGMDDYMSKPLNRALLEETLRKWLPAIAATPAATAARTASPAAAPRAPAPSAPAGARAPAAHVPPAHGRAAVDAAILEDLLEMMGGEFTELVRVYLEDTPGSIATLERAAAAGDVDGLVGPAHSLKSTSANLGALALSEMARKIEHGARSKSLEGEAVMLVAELATEFQRVAAELRRVVAAA
jgi:signal transduction histidine kinase/DNA-binding response OmpR family regulator/HPt (histidine-containing phosphotransfer) domain-containing protein